MVIWTETAISHIEEFIDEARNNTGKTAKSYMIKLIDYMDVLNTMPQIGKKLESIILDYEIRQIVYKSHRVIYSIKNKNIFILAVFHTKIDINKALKNLKKNINNI